MRHSRFIALAMATGAVVLAPTSGQAAGYSHYTSHSSACGYTLQYPAGWKSTPGAAELFSTSTSTTQYAIFSVLCIPASSHATVRALTKSEMTSYRKRNLIVNAPKYAHGAGIFTAHGSFSGKGQSIVEVTSVTQGGKGYVFSFLASPTMFKRYLNQYAHLISTFTPR